MKFLFTVKGKHIWIVDEENLIFSVDNIYVNKYGEEVHAKNSYKKNYYDDDYDLTYDIECFHEHNPMIDKVLLPKSTIEPEEEIDDIFGNFGFKNEDGEFVIEPQYADAFDFTNGLAAVNLNRTWYKTPDGKRYYENHRGYIDTNGKTVIGFRFDEAFPFNKYGVAVVKNIGEDWYLIDEKGNEIPDSRFPWLSHYYDYNHRYLDFAYGYDCNDVPLGIYDTKARKILHEPAFYDITEISDNFIEVTPYDYRIKKYFINSKGEEIEEASQYDKFSKLTNTLWACYKNDTITVVKIDNV